MWEQISSNRKKTVLLLSIMALLLLMLGYFFGLFLFVFVVVLAVMIMVEIWSCIKSVQNKLIFMVITPIIAFMVLEQVYKSIMFKTTMIGLISAIVIWMVLTLIAYFSGDKIILAASKATKISPRKNRQLYNLVQEMQIASGLRNSPSLYIIDDAGLNAFATGRDIRNSSVAVTSGLLETLTRDELQAVIAHEIAHIKNRDVLLMGMCAVFVGTATALEGIVNRLTSSDNHQSALESFLLVMARILLTVPTLSMKMVYFAISRRREYLADACAVLYTRYPPSLASALQKIEASAIQMENAHAAMSPMYINNPFHNMSGFWAQRWNTHPPISERIRILCYMSGGYSLAEYNNAYKKIYEERKSIIKKR